MERIGQLEKRVSVLEEDFDEEALAEEAEDAAAAAAALEAEMAREAGALPPAHRSPVRERRRSRSRGRY